MSSSYLHYEDFDGSPICGRHKAYPNEDFLVDKKPSYEEADRLGVDICDACLYINWRRAVIVDLLKDVPKCQIAANNNLTITHTTCELPRFIHEAHPDETSVHWSFDEGCWL